METTTKQVRGLGHDVYADGKLIGRITRYGDRWFVTGTRQLLGYGTKQEAAEKLVETETAS